MEFCLLSVDTYAIVYSETSDNAGSDPGEDAEVTNDEIERQGGPAFPQPCCDTGHAPNTPWGMAGGRGSLVEKT